MEYALPPLTTCTAYLHILAYDMLHSHSMCHFHTQSVSYCKTIMQDHVTQLRQSSMLKLALILLCISSSITLSLYDV